MSRNGSWSAGGSLALASLASLVAAGSAVAIPPMHLSDIAAGNGGFVAIGLDEQDLCGGSVSDAGDVNGDGLSDVVVGALAAAGNTGQSYVVFGRAVTTPLDLQDVAWGKGGFAINGIDAGDYAGTSVSGAGDVNGDGLPDVIIGAPLASPGGRVSAGESYVVFGKADTAPVFLSDVVAGNGGFVINGFHDGDLSGQAVSGAGDVNGDGLADVLLGAPNADPHGHGSAGECYVIFGKADTAPVNLSDVAAGVGGFLMNGIDVIDYCGLAVSGAGDVNGDGLADLLVAAPDADANGHFNAGETYVVFGKAGTAPVELSDVVAGDGGFVLRGIDVTDRSGWSVSGAGDVNGDNLADVVVGAPFADPGFISAGESYVVFGKADGTVVELADVVSGTGGFAINGETTIDFSGRCVSGAGDVNGDGLSDLFVGAELASGSGKSYVVFGKADGTAVALTDVAAGDGGFAIDGINGYESGNSLSGAGDVNGDGRTDVMVGVWGADAAGPQSGAAYLVFNPLLRADVNGDGAVGIADLLDLLAGWGPCGEPCPPACASDVNADCTVGIVDLLLLLADWS